MWAPAASVAGDQNGERLLVRVVRLGFATCAGEDVRLSREKEWVLGRLAEQPIDPRERIVRAPEIERERGGGNLQGDDGAEPLDAGVERGERSGRVAGGDEGVAVLHEVLRARTTRAGEGGGVVVRGGGRFALANQDACPAKASVGVIRVDFEKTIEVASGASEPAGGREDVRSCESDVASGGTMRLGVRDCFERGVEIAGDSMGRGLLQRDGGIALVDGGLTLEGAQNLVDLRVCEGQGWSERERQQGETHRATIEY